MTILVVEDEKAIREVETAYIKNAGYSVIETDNGEEALNIFSSKGIDLIVLDINLPKIDGIEVCKRIKKYSDIPIILVTARSQDIDELKGFQIGADDYIKKDFSPDILIARIKNLTKRYDRKIVKINNLIIDPDKNLVLKNGIKISLTTTQFNILYLLSRNPGIIFTREEIFEKAYSHTSVIEAFDRTIDAHIKSIRKAIEEDSSNPEYIITVIGKGYKFNDDIA